MNENDSPGDQRDLTSPEATSAANDIDNTPTGDL